MAKRQHAREADGGRDDHGGDAQRARRRREQQNAGEGKGADGEALNYQGCDIYTFRGGKIAAKDTYWKMVEQKDRL